MSYIYSIDTAVVSSKQERVMSNVISAGFDNELGRLVIRRNDGTVDPAVRLDGRIVSMAAVRELMDDALCDEIHGTVDTDQQFLDAYLQAHEEKFGQPFAFN
jgi:hypothetical protein